MGKVSIEMDFELDWMRSLKKRLEKEKVSADCIWGILMLGGLQRRPRISSLLRKNTERC